LDNNYFSTSELATLLGLTRQAVFKKIKAGEIKAIRPGRDFLIPKDELPRILGEVLSEKSKKEIEQIIKRLVLEYGETLRLLARE
jgi:excisionase family DNA binding protein